ncbi:PIR protein [Plasmodium reichenowi]|uniref:PIR protein n=1 Tax=Plasmodium reichenowi TaxID=5854 RepID=A0A2P9DRU2_PLARE|nr:PIR protein [Plasmodium reichenowi]
MKLHYTKILLFVIPLNTLVTSYHVKNKNKLYTTPHHTQTNRSLCECDIQSSIYDKDADMKSVKENFDRQTSQRFQEYEEHVKDKRQKRKEERDKNIQKIIDKDKMEKSLAEKIEKGCLRCGCGLGGVAASVGLFGGLGIYGWEMAELAAAEKAAAAKGAEAGVQTLIDTLKDQLGITNLYDIPLVKSITTETYNDGALISKRVIDFYESFSMEELERQNYIMLLSYKTQGEAEGTQGFVEYAKRIVGEAVGRAKEMTVQVTETQMASLKTGKLAEVAAESSYLYNAIGYSFLAILIIVLIMIIFYLVLRYRRKKKMKKKAEYTKLLNQ